MYKQKNTPKRKDFQERKGQLRPLEIILFLITGM